MPQTNTFASFLTQVDYSLMDSLNADPESTDNGSDHQPRQVFSGHYVPVTPTPLPNHEYIAHSDLFEELGLSQDLAQDEQFSRLFSGDITVAKDPMRPFGWATGYALSIYGTENTLSNVLFGLEMAMGMDAPYLYSRVYLKVSAGRCN